MRDAIEITGQRFGHLTVIKRSFRKTKGCRSLHWICECDCGRRVIARSDNLRSGRTTKCSACRNKAGRQSVFFFDGGVERG